MFTFKACSSCKQEKSVEDFHYDRSGKHGRAAYCKECANKKAREHHSKRSLEWRKERRNSANKINKDNKEKAVSLLGGKCFDCGNTFPLACYDFHHLDPSEKEGNPSSFLNKSHEKMIAELSKCVLLCANCHRIRHFEGGY